MRVGNNPLKGGRAESMPKLVGIVITHLPEETGYHAYRLEIVQTCLETMRANAGMDLAMCVWDNGSGPQLREWLQEEYKPEYLVLSPNVGKSSARTASVRMFPPETVVCVSDDDMLYLPNWLAPQLDLLHHFPNVGAVSGYPVRTQFRWGIDSTLKWAEQNATHRWGRFIPEEWERDWCASIGRDYVWHRTKHAVNDQDLLIEYQGRFAYGTAHHCQFIALAGRIEFLVEWHPDAVADEKPFDRAIDAQGYLRLTTTERLVRHMGNVIDPDLRREINRCQTITPA